LRVSRRAHRRPSYDLPHAAAAGILTRIHRQSRNDARAVRHASYASSCSRSPTLATHTDVDAGQFAHHPPAKRLVEDLNVDLGRPEHR
jgi:hypothetical protein